MRTHTLKIDAIAFSALLSGAKTSEVRNDDRGFEVGDTVHLTCSDGQSLDRIISHIQRGYGLPDGLCVLSYINHTTSSEGFVRYRPAITSGGNPCMEFYSDGIYIMASEAEAIIAGLRGNIEAVKNTLGVRCTDVSFLEERCKMLENELSAPSGYRVIPKQPTDTMVEVMAFNLCAEFGGEFTITNKAFAMAVYKQAWELGIRSQSETSPRTQALEEAARVAEAYIGGEHEAQGRAAEEIASELRDLSSQPVEDGLPQDVINLVITAREFWDDYNNLSDESKALYKALEAFVSRVPYENEPAALPASPGASE